VRRDPGKQKTILEVSDDIEGIYRMAEDRLCRAVTYSKAGGVVAHESMRHNPAYGIMAHLVNACCPVRSFETYKLAVDFALTRRNGEHK
jgi:hypothetical protein